MRAICVLYTCIYIYIYICIYRYIYSCVYIYIVIIDMYVHLHFICPPDPILPKSCAQGQPPAPWQCLVRSPCGAGAEPRSVPIAELVVSLETLKDGRLVFHGSSLYVYIYIYTYIYIYIYVLYIYIYMYVYIYYIYTYICMYIYKI